VNQLIIDLKPYIDKIDEETDESECDSENRSPTSRSRFKSSNNPKSRNELNKLAVGPHTLSNKPPLRQKSIFKQNSRIKNKNKLPSSDISMNLDSAFIPEFKRRFSQCSSSKPKNQIGIISLLLLGKIKILKKRKRRLMHAQSRYNNVLENKIKNSILEVQNLSIDGTKRKKSHKNLVMAALIKTVHGKIIVS